MINAFKAIRLGNTLASGNGTRFLFGADSGAFLSDLNNMSGTLDSRLYQTGSTLYNLISSSAAGVGGVQVTGHASQSGILGFSGMGNVTVLTGVSNFIYFSGNSNDGINLSGNLQTTGQNLYNWLGIVSGNSNTVATNLGTTGSTLYNDILGLSGIVNANSGINQISITGKLMSGILTFSGGGNIVVYTGSGNNVYISGLYTDSINLSGNLASTGSTLNNKINSLSGFVNNTSLSVTGFSAQTGLINLSGIGGITLYTGAGNFIYFSGNNGDGINLSGNLQTTGSNLYNWIGVVSGNDNTTRTNLGTTGSNLYNYIVGLSGALGTSGSNLYSLIKNFSGNQQSFSTGINPTGFDNYYVGYPLGAFPSIPRVFPSIEVSGNIMYGVNITGRSTAGFFALFSDNIGESGVVLHIFATTNS